MVIVPTWATPSGISSGFFEWNPSIDLFNLVASMNRLTTEWQWYPRLCAFRGRQTGKTEQHVTRAVRSVATCTPYSVVPSF